ncbi:MAG: V-type ATP synthase subunit E [Methanolinea sp.]|jgi:V/A-type H+-transporting ATPase subunit E|nr:V-type ATP synthase subunit E [Methanolinea sp.]
MSVEKIEQRILSDAKTEADRILKKAGEEAGLVIEKARKEAEKQGRQVRTGEEEKTAQACAQILSQSRIEARKISRSAREKAIKEVFERAKVEIGKIRENPRYPDIFFRLASEGIRILGHDRVELEVHPADRPLAEKFISKWCENPGECTLSIRTIMTNGGVIVSVPGGTVKVNNTVEARFERMEREIAARVARILFQEGGDTGGR